MLSSIVMPAEALSSELIRLEEQERKKKNKKNQSQTLEMEMASTLLPFL